MPPTPEASVTQAATNQPVDHPLRRAFAWGGLVGSGTVFLIALLLWALLAASQRNGSRDARLAEAMQLGGSARDATRVRYSRQEVFTPVVSDGSFWPPGFDGEYYSVPNVVSYAGPDAADVYVVPATWDYPLVRVRFHWQAGNSEYEYLGPFGWKRR